MSEPGATRMAPAPTDPDITGADMPDATCEWCSELFTPYRNPQRFCSSRCNKASVQTRARERGYQPPVKQRVCPSCSLSFETNSQRKVHCSQACLRAAEERAAEQRAHLDRILALGTECGRNATRYMKQWNARNFVRSCPCGRLRPKHKKLCNACRQRNYDIRIAKVKRDVKEWRRRQRQTSNRDPQNHRQRARKYGVEFDPTVRRVPVLDRDGWVCGLCHKPIDNILYVATASEDYGTIDHVIPMSMGGGHVWSNVRAAHNRCNWEAFDSTQREAG